MTQSNRIQLDFGLRRSVSIPFDMLPKPQFQTNVNAPPIEPDDFIASFSQHSSHFSPSCSDTVAPVNSKRKSGRRGNGWSNNKKKPCLDKSSPRAQSSQSQSEESHDNNENSSIDEHQSRGTFQLEDARVQVKLLKCLVLKCKRAFYDENSLNQHLARVHMLHPILCHVKDCFQSFVTQSELNGHIALEHNELESFQCSHCSKQLKTYAQLAKHNFTRHMFGEFTCSICSFVGITRREVYRHFDHQHSSSSPDENKPINGPLYRCSWNQCRASSPIEQSVVNHIEQLHFKIAAYKAGQAQWLEDPRKYVKVV